MRGAGEGAGCLTWGLGRRVVDHPCDALDLVDDPPAHLLQESPWEFIRLSAHHVQAGHGSEDADVTIDPRVSLDADSCEKDLCQRFPSKWHGQCLVWVVALTSVCVKGSICLSDLFCMLANLFRLPTCASLCVPRCTGRLL
jgi:hypothetical protein